MKPRPEQDENERHYEIHASADQTTSHQRVLKHGETFALLSPCGDIIQSGTHDEGIYFKGTRYLSRQLLELHNKRPILLNSNIDDRQGVLAIDLTNPELPETPLGLVPQGVIHISRSKFLWNDTCHELLRVTNYHLQPVEFVLRMRFDADYADIFEVRGSRRERRGCRLAQLTSSNSMTLAYEGIDGVVRSTAIHLAPTPVIVGQQWIEYRFRLEPHQDQSITMRIACSDVDERAEPVTYRRASELLAASFNEFRHRACLIESPFAPFNDWLARSYTDLHMLLTETPEGLFPYAGVPWYSTPFGRDGLITAMMCLGIDPEIGRGVLRFLARLQAVEVNPEKDAAPGKILHEMRHGEMVNLGELPFGLYYGSVDSTPLFIMLAAMYWRRTGDLEITRSIWPHVERALEWIDRYGDMDGDGLIEYQTGSERGLAQQGWKDSHDSVFHADGSPAPMPIALCEVQAYVYAARRGAADMALALGLAERAAGLESQAEQLRILFEESFWDEKLGTYVIALDGAKNPCRVRTSNAGHCLLGGIVNPSRARRVAESLTGSGMFSGWGIRTVHEQERAYNPMSYHNGSVWPHDNALIAAGMARYGLTDHVERVLAGLFDTSQFMEFDRLPELFCGFDRRPGQAPTLYPVACSPQAWATAAPFLLLESCLNMRIDAPAGEVLFDHPMLPPFLTELTISNLAVGDSRLDLRLIRYPLDVGINIERRSGNARVRIIK